MRIKKPMGILVCALMLFLCSLPASAAPAFGMSVPGSAAPIRENCRIYQFRVNDPEPPLNIRSSPEIRPDNVIATIPNGRIGAIVAEHNGWFKIAWSDANHRQQEGWIAANRTEYACNEFMETVTGFPFPLVGRLIGAGSHQYGVELRKGQTLVLRPDRQMNEPSLMYWPTAITGPDIQGRTPGVPNSYGYWWRKPGDTTAPEPAEWRWTAKESGRYLISYDSNYKGYSYGPCILTIED